MFDPALAQPSELLELVEAAEPNPLLRRVDALCERRAWDDLVELARRCREAVERGKQLWPIAEHIDYRLALEAPAPYAAAVLTPTAGRFAPGPLTEVAASTHSFDDLAPYLSLPSTAGVVAAERVLRGEDLSGRPQAHPEVLELPLRLEPWEPAYALATYRPHGVEVASPELAPLTREARATPGARIEDPDLSAALLDLVGAWVAGSNARAEVAVSEGAATAAIGALGASTGAFRIGTMDAASSLALMAWAGAGGGAHGRRRGAAAGRSAAWWAAAALCDLEWPPDPGVLGEELSRLRWYRWEPQGLPGGWHLHLAVEAPTWGWAAAIGAEDRADGP
jgi:hypothetical protein